MSDHINHECGLALIRLLKPLEFYKKKYGTNSYGLNKLYLMLEKQHNRGQDGAGFASVKLDTEPGQRFLHRERSANQNPIQEIFDASNKRIAEEINNNPSFKDKLYFIYLNKKQNSLDEIIDFKEKVNSKIGISEISEITKRITICKDQSEFNKLIREHENIISKLISKDKIKDQLFNDFNGEIKSLGAWGGDFILASSNEFETKKYFKNKGFNFIFEFDKVILN